MKYYPKPKITKIQLENIALLYTPIVEKKPIPDIEPETQAIAQPSAERNKGMQRKGEGNYGY